MPAPRTRSGQLENAGLDGEKRNSHASATGVDIGGKRRTSTFEEEATVVTPLETAKDLVVDVIRLEDDPRTPALTFRMWFMGIGLSTFGATLATVYYFKPQAVFVSVIFLALISYITGEALAFIIPSKGWVGKWFDPHPFNKKEHAAIVIMASAAVSTPLATEVLAAQRLYYNQV